jgi:hypothetical protein
MASLLQAVRNAGANNVVILGAWRSTGPSFCAIGFISKKSAWLRQRSTCGSRRLADAYEAADSGLLSPELAAGIRRVKGVRRLRRPPR